jgi:hypothetical protein
MTKEMKSRHVAYGQHRYRRFQALDDSLQIFFEVSEKFGWYTVQDVAAFMEWEVDSPSAQRRVRRIMEALVRVDKVEQKGNSAPGKPHFYRSKARVRPR